jgi:hypothetical protein
LIPQIQALMGAFDEIEFESKSLQQELAQIRRGATEGLAPARQHTGRLLTLLRRALAEGNYLEVERFNEPPALD